MPTLALVHTVASLVPVFERLAREIAPDVETFNIVDESLLRTTIREGSLSPATARRLAGYVASAEAAGADAVLVTCSSVGAAVEAARPLTGVPVLRVDEPMADEAVAVAGRGDGRIGVLGTLRTTLEPTADLIRRRATAADARVEVIERLAEGAFEALGAGETEEHDRMVRDALVGLAGDVDVVVLAQASMARVVDALPPGTMSTPVLSSPRLGLERAATVLRAGADARDRTDPVERLSPAAAIEAGS
jgi:Asp/Glu/hydantoin racemase